MDADPFDLVGDVIDGQFRVDAVAGEGDLSVVYRGWHLGVAAKIAIKCLNLPATLDAQLVEPFVQSFREGTKLHYRLARSSLHIAQSLASGTTLAPRTGHLVPYLVREWFEGQSLAATLAQRRAQGLGGYKLGEALTLLDGAAEGLAFAHSEGVTHHSINPSNLFVVESLGKVDVKLLDFGVARVMNEEGGQSAGLRVLMPEYAAPEQIDRQLGAVGPWTDVYALALVLMETLAGKPLFTSKEGAPAAQVDPEHRPTLRAHGVTLPKAIEEVLARAVALDPTKRPKDAASFWKAVRDAEMPKPTALPSKSVASRVPPKLPSTSQAPRGAATHPPSALPRVGTLSPPRISSAPEPTKLESALPVMPKGFAIGRKTIAGLGNEVLPPLSFLTGETTAPKITTTPQALPPPPPLPVMMASGAPLRMDPPPAPSPDAASAPPPPPPLGELAAPRDFTTTEVDPQDPLDAPIDAAQKPSFAPAAGVRKLHALVRVALGVSAAGLALLMALTIYILATPRSTRIEPATPAPSASSVGGPSDVPSASALPSFPAGEPSVHPFVAKRFTRTLALAALDTVNGGLATCARPGGRTGMGSVRVNFTNDGTVLLVSVGPPFAGTPEGTCIADRFRGVRIGPFGGPVGALNYNFTVPP